MVPMAAPISCDSHPAFSLSRNSGVSTSTKTASGNCTAFSYCLKEVYGVYFQ